MVLDLVVARSNICQGERGGFIDCWIREASCFCPSFFTILILIKSKLDWGNLHLEIDEWRHKGL